MSERLGQVKGSFSRDPTLASNQLVEARPGPANPLSELGLRKLRWLEKLLEKHFARMERILCRFTAYLRQPGF